MAFQSSFPRANSAGSSSRLLIAIAISTVCIASLNYLHFQTQAVTPKQHNSHEDDGFSSLREAKALKRQLNDAIAESKRKDEEIALLQAKLDQQSDSSQQEIQQPINLAPANINNTTITNQTPEYQQKALSINSFYWPSLHSGLLGKLHAAQNPIDCNAAKYFVWRSRIKHEEDTRGLTAWGHAAKSHLMHGSFYTLCAYCLYVVFC
jgi:hypothetical protein